MTENSSGGNLGTGPAFNSAAGEAHRVALGPDNLGGDGADRSGRLLAVPRLRARPRLVATLSRGAGEWRGDPIGLCEPELGRGSPRAPGPGQPAANQAGRGRDLASHS